MLKARGGRVIFEAPPALYRLFQTLEGVDILIPYGSAPPPFECHARLLDLPGLFGTTLDTVPRRPSYLTVDRKLAAHGSVRMGTAEKFRLGIAWAGDSGHTNDRNRSIDPALFCPLAEIVGVSVYSLQVGRDGEAAQVFGDRVTDLAPFLTDFAETAASMSNLDLVVSADTAVVHLAGALGRPVWTLLPAVPDWRWLLDREDSPWYPTMRLFRQQQREEWQGVMERVYKALSGILESGRS